MSIKTVNTFKKLALITMAVHDAYKVAMVLAVLMESMFRVVDLWVSVFRALISMAWMLNGLIIFHAIFVSRMVLFHFCFSVTMALNLNLFSTPLTIQTPGTYHSKYNRFPCPSFNVFLTMLLSYLWHLDFLNQILL